MNIIEVNKEHKSLYQPRKVRITFNMVKLMYSWTFRKQMPKNLPFVNAYREVCDQWKHDDSLIDILISNSERIAGDYESFKKEMNKFEEVAK